MTTPRLLIGRDAEIAALITELDGGGRVALVGPAGVGKSAVADAVADSLSALGGRNFVLALRATPARGEIPFGVIAPYVDVTRPSSTVGDAVDAVAGGIAASADDRHAIVVVDDWSLLDNETKAVIDVLIERYKAAVLVTIRIDERASAALPDVQTRGFDIVELAALDRADTMRVVDALLDTSLTSAVAQQLWQRSRGNPLFIRELIAAGIQNGAEVPSRVAEMISLRLSTLTEGQREALRMLAVAGDLPGSVVAGMIESEIVEELMASTWIVAGGSGTVRLAHPLVEEAIRSSASPTELVATARALAQVARGSGRCPSVGGSGRCPGVGDDRQAGFDVLQVARWHVVGGVEAPSTMWRAAARRARVLAQLELATQFAETAVSGAEGDGVIEALTLVEIVTSAGDFQRAEAVGRELQRRLMTELAGAPKSRPPAEMLAIVALCRSHNAFWGLGDVDLATEGIDDAIAALDRCQIAEAPDRARLELLAERASYLAFTGRMAAGLRHAEAVLDHVACDARSATRAHFAAGIALIQLGRPRDAAVTLRRGLEQAEQIPTFGRGQFTTFLTSTLALALVETGDVVGAIALGRDGLNEAIASGDVTRRSLAHYALGRSLLARGHAAESDSILRQAVDLDLTFRAAGYAPWSLTCLIQSRALHRGTAPPFGRDLIGLLESLPRGDTRFWEGEGDRAKAWALIANGNLARGSELLERAHEVAAAGEQWAMAAWIAHDLLRVEGRATDANRLLAATDSLTDGAYGLLRRHALAHRGTIDELAGCADAFAAAGFDLIASEIWFDVAAREGRRASSPALPDAYASGRLLVDDCGPVHTPAVVRALGPGRLTPRQRHIAHLASRGLTNRDIAARLGLSVRTVANQLQRVYDATGLGRGDLAEVVGA